MDIDTNKITYLQMIQSVIDRMSNISADIKGFCVAVSAGIVALTIDSTDIVSFGISILFIMIFLVLDIYYLGIERQYRYLYNKVRMDEIEVDFNLGMDLKKSEINQAKAKFFQCLSSKSIILFYIPLTLIMTILMILKYMEVI